jgi:hypothetical protein
MVRSWNGISLFICDVLGIILVVRLLSLRLHRIYKVFCAYVVFGLLSSSIYFLDRYLRILDYRISYIVVAIGTWVLTWWMVYSLLEAILARLPGILRFSRILLWAVFALAILLGIVSARSEFKLAQSHYGVGSLRFAVAASIVWERVVTTVSLFALLAIQAFVLWFPVQLPRNLVFFSIGFVFNFVCEAILLVIREHSPTAAAAVIDPANLLVLSASFAYFAVAITPAGESIPMRIGHRWHPAEQERLVQQLADINDVLLRTARH